MLLSWENMGSLKISGAEMTAATLDLTAIHAAHADFVWASLHRLGIEDRDLPDLLQEVFLVVHRRLGSFDRSSKLTTWLFGICLRVAAAHRRRAHVRREISVENVPDAGTGPALTDELLDRQREAQELARVLDEIDLEKRAVFVMFEIEEMSCDRIASLLGIPVGTVHSRLHGARKSFQAALRRRQARQQRRGGS